MVARRNTSKLWPVKENEVFKKRVQLFWTLRSEGNIWLKLEVALAVDVVGAVSTSRSRNREDCEKRSKCSTERRGANTSPERK